MIRISLLVTLILTLRSAASADEPADSRVAQMLTTKTGVKYAIWPEQPSQPVPTLFVFAGSAQEALNDAYFRQAGNQLAKQGYLCVSVDLACHGEQARDGEPAGIDGWRVRLEHGEDFVAESTSRFTKVLDELIELKLTEPEKVAVCGTSRGGFMALHFAAADARVKAAAAFAPVTELLVLREFHSMENRGLADRLSLKHQADRLAGRAVWVIIGDRDDRVSTDESIAFCRAVTLASLKSNKPALADLHVVAEPQGHTTPQGAAAQAAAWIAAQWGTLK